MVADRMMGDWRLRWAFPWLGRLPTTMPWQLASWLGRDSRHTRQATENYLQARFAQVFPAVDGSEHRRWARAHMDMLALEMLDAVAFDRLGALGGPRIDVHGWEAVRDLQRDRQGIILVLNHYDRLLATPIGLARTGVVLNTLTMPVLDNPGLNAAQRAFLMRKIQMFTDVTGGQWRTTSESLRPVHEGLRDGEAWIILADAWAPGFGRLRAHAFLGGHLQLPTGIERLARSTKATLVHGRAFSLAPDQLRVDLRVLDDEAESAIDGVIAQLEMDVAERPWAWWHWGQWDQMWRPSK